MNVTFIQLHRDRSCAYCNHSEYRDNFDGRKFYNLRTTRDINSFIVCICEHCMREIRQQIGMILDPRVHAVDDMLNAFPADIKDEVITEVQTMIQRVDY